MWLGADHMGHCGGVLMWRIFKIIILLVGGIAALCFLASLAGEHDREDCEVRIAKELNTTAVYINGHCMVKGFGRFDGR
ncbi:TPA: hypothetical protein MAK69_000472 [Klebsiella aerogenes]|nr:hypothetical protein [Klebsiella aerogenes]